MVLARHAGNMIKLLFSHPEVLLEPSLPALGVLNSIGGTVLSLSNLLLSDLKSLACDYLTIDFP